MPTPNPRLKHERRLRGWSQSYLAEQIDVPDYYISRWERGEVLPSPLYQQRLCELFGKTTQDLGFFSSPDTPIPETLSITEAIQVSASTAQEPAPVSSAEWTEALSPSLPSLSTDASLSSAEENGGSCHQGRFDVRCIAATCVLEELSNQRSLWTFDMRSCILLEEYSSERMF